ncbi:hypothetical protein cand_021600 [Cryptosporidium andersoni]|uniref:Pep3/Vps18 beta-propeller domain-containing protein n=1 Tax=Cryptosporidium andersoni TaxID=117008 RepID=A0A1J4MSH2_9CRYT|nr:hypothetical protein cand_021600 [Cryptosporidium andersoni]
MGLQDDNILDLDETLYIKQSFYGYDISWDNVIQRLLSTGSLKLPITIDHAVFAGNIFYISLLSGQLLRWCPNERITDLITLEPPIGISSIFDNMSSSSSSTLQVFTDSTGHHALVSIGTGETWYLHGSFTKARHLSKLSRYYIQSVGWNNWENKKKSSSSVSIIIGCRSGTLLTTILGPDISSSSTVIRILYEIPSSPILDIYLDSINFEDNKFQANSEIDISSFAVIVATSSRLLLWSGYSRILDLFMSNENIGTVQKPGLQIGSIESSDSFTTKIRILDYSCNKKILLWINSRDVKAYPLYHKDEISLINNSNMIQNQPSKYYTIGYPNNFDYLSYYNKRPNSIECTRYHIIFLFDDSISILSAISCKPIIKTLVGTSINPVMSRSGYTTERNNCNFHQVLRNLVINYSKLLFSNSSETINSKYFLWAYSDEFIYKLTLVNEEEILWKEWLYIGFYKEALQSIDISCSDEQILQRKRDLIYRLEIIDHLRNGNIQEVAHLLSKLTSISFNDICLMLIQHNYWFGILIYLKHKFLNLSKSLSNLNSSAEFIVLSIWLVEVHCYILSSLSVCKNSGCDQAQGIIKEDIEQNLAYGKQKVNIPFLTSKDSNKTERNTPTSSKDPGILNMSNSEDVSPKISYKEIRLQTIENRTEESNKNFRKLDNTVDPTLSFESISLSLRNILQIVSGIDEIQSILYRILLQYDCKEEFFYYAELCNDWNVVIQELIYMGLVNSRDTKRCYEKLLAVDNISKRDSFVYNFAPLLYILDAGRFVSLCTRPSLSTIKLELLLPYILQDPIDIYNFEERNYNLNQLGIVLIEHFLRSINNFVDEKDNSSKESINKIGRINTSARLGILATSNPWNGSKAVWNVLAILCSKMENGEELLLSYIAPLLELTSTYEANDNDILGLGYSEKYIKQLNEFSIKSVEFDLPFLLSICRTKRYKRLEVYICCLLGMYDMGMELCLKELQNISLTREIIYRFIDNSSRRRWILDLIKPLGKKGDIESLLKLLDASPQGILTLSDILEVIPDSLHLGLFQKPIVDTIQLYDQLLQKRQKANNDYMRNYQHLQSDVSAIHSNFNILTRNSIECNSLCGICFENVLDSSPCFSLLEVKKFIEDLQFNCFDNLAYQNILDNFFTSDNLSVYSTWNIKNKSAKTTNFSAITYDLSNYSKIHERDQVFSNLQQNKELSEDNGTSVKKLISPSGSKITTPCNLENNKRLERDDIQNNKYSGYFLKYYSSKVLVFPCSHSFHFGCVLFTIVSLMTEEEIPKIRRMIQNICDSASKYNKKSTSPNSTSFQHWNNEISKICTQECPLCGESMIRSVLKPFINTESNYDELEAQTWTIENY